MKPLFEVRNLSVGYDHPVIHQISFTANQGELIGILGRNGYGKTTLLRGITGSIKHFWGEICVDGVDCTGFSPKKKAAYLSILPQYTEIMNGILAKEIIEMGLYPHSSLFRNATKEKEQHMQNIANMLGISDLLNTNCEKLSQGQRQLVLLARLLVQNTPVMLLDEPDAALDFYNTHMLFSTLHDLVKHSEKAALLVLHNPELALKWCDKILVIKDGMLVSEIQTKTATEAQVEHALKLLYADISIKKDPYTDLFRCYIGETDKKQHNIL